MEERNEPETTPAPAPAPAVIKRRWAIVRKAGGGAALLAVAGAIALSEPADQSSSTQDPAGGDSEISAEA